MASSCDSQTAYSSAVRVGSVPARHWAIQLVAVVHGEERVGVALLDGQQHRSGLRPLEEYVAGGDAAQAPVGQAQPQRAVGIQAFGDAFDGLAGEARDAGSPRPWARSVQASAIGREAAAVPQRRASGRRPRPAPSARRAAPAAARACARRRWWRAAPATTGARGQIDADADGDPQDRRRPCAGLDKDAGGLLAGDQQIVRPFQADQRGRHVGGAQGRRPPGRRRRRSAPPRPAACRW